MNPPLWTASHPTAPGLYWLLEPGREPTVVRVGDGGGGWIDHVGSDGMHTAAPGSLWCPAVPPPVPNG